MRLDFKNRTIKYIALTVSSMLGLANVAFNDYKNAKGISIFIAAIFIVNIAYDYYLKKLELKDTTDGLALKVRISIFFYTYLIGAYAMFLSGAFENSSILMYFAIVVFISIEFFGKKLGTLIYIMTMLQGYFYYSIFMTDDSAWKILMTIASLTAGYFVGIYLESMKKNQVLLKQKINEMETLFQISKLIDDFPGVDQIISNITKIIVESLSFGECYLMLYDEDKGQLINKSTYTKEEKSYNNSIPSLLEPGDGFPGKVYLSGESIFFYGDSIDELDCSSCDEREIKAFGVVPIKFYERTLGTITVTSRDYLKYDEQSEKVLKTIASRVGMVINSQKMFRELENATRKDSLTSLFNHGYFYEKLEYEIDTIKNQDLSLFVIMMDLDKFKLINDRYGHLLGDEVLKKIGDILHSMSTNQIVAARYGGEEFSLMVKCKDKSEVCKILYEFRKRIFQISKELKELEKSEIQITVSIGVSKYLEDSVIGEELVDIADKRMYISKSLGGDRIMNYCKEINN